jgi:hypothetical protein
MMRTRGGRFSIPPGGRVRLELSRVIQDPQGGPPLDVSSEVLPDALAVYFLGTTIAECTRGMERHTEALEHQSQLLERYEVVTRRATRWQKIFLVGLAALLAASLGNLGFYLWHGLHGW